MISFRTSYLRIAKLAGCITIAALLGGCPPIELPQINPNNRVPEANAGPDANVCLDATVTLNASASTDPDGDSLSYSWTQTSGPSVALQDANSARPRWMAAVTGVYEFTVAVTDGQGGTDADTVRVTVSACSDESDRNGDPDDTDCDDLDPSIHHGATELCDGVDNDCDGQIDEGDVCASDCIVSVFLSDLAPTDVHVGWGEILADEAICGPITIRGEVFDKGIFAHANSEVTYELGGGWTSFSAVAAINDFTPPGTGCADAHPEEVSATFTVLIDGVEVWRQDVNALDPGVPLQVGVSGANELTLRTVAFGPRGIDSRHTVWADAQLCCDSAIGCMIVLDHGIHHLGDDSLGGWGLFSLAPDPEGTAWESPAFAVAASISSASLVADVLQTGPSSPVLVNGVFAGWLPEWEYTHEWAIDRQMPIATSLLHATGNVIRIEAAYTPGDQNYDDFLFKNLRVELQR